MLSMQADSWVGLRLMSKSSEVSLMSPVADRHRKEYTSLTTEESGINRG